MGFPTGLRLYLHHPHCSGLLVPFFFFFLTGHSGISVEIGKAGSVYLCGMLFAGYSQISCRKKHKCRGQDTAQEAEQAHA